MIRVILPAALFILLLYNSHLFSFPVIVGEHEFPINITGSLEYLEDRSGSISFEQAAGSGSSLWSSVSGDSINFGYTRSVYWFKFSLEDKRTVKSRLLFEINFPTLDYVDFYYPSVKGGYGVLKTGDRRLFNTREIMDSRFIFSLNPQSDNAAYYFRVENGGSFRFKTKIYSDSSFIQDRNRYLPIAWFIYGIVMFSGIFYFFLFLYLRDRSYLYFSFFTLSIFFYQISVRGFAFQFLWPSYPVLGNKMTILFTCLMGLFSALFLRKILDTQSNNKVLHNIFSIFGIIVFPILAVLSLILPYNIISLMRYYTMLLYGIMIIPSAAYYMKKGNRFAVYFLSGFAFLVITNIMTSLMVLGKIELVHFSEWIIDIGFIQIILLSSLGLVDRFKTMTGDLLDSRQSINEKNQMLILANEELAATNEELEAINEEFEAQNRELLNSEKALSASEMEMKDIFNSTNDAFIIHDQDGRILDVNSRMLEMYGVSRETALSLSVDDISSPGIDVSSGLEYRKRVMEGEELLFEWRALRLSGDIEFFVEVGLKKFLWRDREVILASIRDLTERKAAEDERDRVRDQLVQAQKMEAVGTLAGGIAHDFNNVLGGIIGSLNLVDHLMQDEEMINSAEIHEYMGTAVESSMRAADMTKQLLTLSRKSELTMKPVAVQDSLRHVVNLCRNSFPKSVELDYVCDDEPLIINADPSHISQAMLNLCVNASHSMTIMRDEGERQGGNLTISVYLKVLDSGFSSGHYGAYPDIPYVMIRVSDTGVGMDEKVRSRIFEPFYTTKMQNEGTGLGLAMTYSIITQHGGFVTVESEPGRGSEFTVYLPQMNVTNAGIKESSNVITAGKGLILVIDDEETIIRVTAGMLKKCGYDVVSSSKPVEAIELFRREHRAVSAVIIDSAMPVMSGLEVYSVMKEIDPEVTVILSSGFMEESVQKKARDMGIREFMNKPYTLEELSRKMSHVLIKIV